MIFLEFPAPQFSIFQYGFINMKNKYFKTQRKQFSYCISQQCSLVIHMVFPPGGGVESPSTAKDLLITSLLPRRLFPLPKLHSSPTNDSFHKKFLLKSPQNYIFGCSHCSYTIFLFLLRTLCTYSRSC